MPSLSDTVEVATGGGGGGDGGGGGVTRLVWPAAIIHHLGWNGGETASHRVYCNVY